MSADGIVLLALVIAVIGALLWRAMLRWRAPVRTAAQETEAVWTDTVAHHLVDATSKSGRKPWE